ncbi:hypothetical protein D3C76_1294860 [compost metagenome]
MACTGILASICSGCPAATISIRCSPGWITPPTVLTLTSSTMPSMGERITVLSSSWRVDCNSSSSIATSFCLSVNSDSTSRWYWCCTWYALIRSSFCCDLSLAMLRISSETVLEISAASRSSTISWALG